MILQELSTGCGWVYTVFFTWCVGFQCIENYRNQSCKGYSSDFALIAFAGFMYYLFNQLEGYVDPYSEAGHVRPIDLFFAIDMVFFSSISYTQTFMYPSEKSNR